MKQFQAYQETAVTTANKGRLVVLLYEGAIKFCKLAKKEAQAKNHQAKNNYLTRAQDIIVELNSVLDMDTGGEVAENLRKLYDFMHTQLVQANIKQDTEKIDQVIGLLEELNEAWKAIAE